MSDNGDSGDVSVIIPAAGDSERMGGDVRKPFMELNGEPILFRTCRRLREIADVFEIIVVAHPDDLEWLRETHWEEARAAGVELVVAGGANRAQSVWNGLEVVSAKAELIAVHDGVRPFVSADTVRALISTARKRGAAVPVIPLSDTPKRVDGDRVVETVARRGLMRVQTPQVFQSDLLIEAFEYRMATGGLGDWITDDAQMVESMGVEVAAVLGNEFNMKITTPSDMKLAGALLAAGLAF